MLKRNAKTAGKIEVAEKCAATADLFSDCVECGQPVAGRSPRCPPCRAARAAAVKRRSARRIYAEKVAAAREPAKRACIVCDRKFEEAPRRGRPRLTCSAACRRKATAAYFRGWKAERESEGTGDLFGGDG